MSLLIEWSFFIVFFSLYFYIVDYYYQQYREALELKRYFEAHKRVIKKIQDMQLELKLRGLTMKGVGKSFIFGTDSFNAFRKSFKNAMQQDLNNYLIQSNQAYSFTGSSKDKFKKRLEDIEKWRR